MKVNIGKEDFLSMKNGISVMPGLRNVSEIEILARSSGHHPARIELGREESLRLFSPISEKFCIQLEVTKDGKVLIRIDDPEGVVAEKSMEYREAERGPDLLKAYIANPQRFDPTAKMTHKG